MIMLPCLLVPKIVSTAIVALSIVLQLFQMITCQKLAISSNNREPFLDQGPFLKLNNATTTRNAVTGCPKYKQVTKCFKGFFDEYTQFKRQHKRQSSGARDSIDFYRSNNGSSKNKRQDWTEVVDTADDNIIPNDCHLFDRFDNCFRIMPCLDWYKSKLANAYNNKYKTFVPKESMNALRLNWHSKCQINHCPKNSDNKCRQIMTLSELDKDNALLLELHALKLQVAAKVTEPRYGCRKINVTMMRVKMFRSSICGDNNDSGSKRSGVSSLAIRSNQPASDISLWCLCRQVSDRLRGVCNLDCTFYAKDSNLASQNLQRTLWECFSVIVIQSIFVYVASS